MLDKLDEVVGFDFVAEADHQRAVAAVLELQAQGRLDALPHEGGCCTVS